MSVASIAYTMGWGVDRTTKRLQLLNGCAPEAVVVGFPDDPEPPVAASVKPVQPIEEKPIGLGEGLVLRAFGLRFGGHGADCLLADGRRVFTVTGRDRIEPGKRIRVEQVPVADALPPQVEEGAEAAPTPTGFVWRMVKAKADA